MRITHGYLQFGSDPFDEFNTTKYFYYDTPPTSAPTEFFPASPHLALIPQKRSRSPH